MPVRLPRPAALWLSGLVCLGPAPVAAGSILERVLGIIESTPQAVLMGLYVNHAENGDPVGTEALRLKVDGSITVLLHSETPPEDATEPDASSALRLQTSSLGATNDGRIRLEAGPSVDPVAVRAGNGATNRADVLGHATMSGPVQGLPPATVSTTAVGASNSGNIVITLRTGQTAETGAGGLP